MRVESEEGQEELTMNLAPMIDVVFLLLIFFMVATTFIEREKEMGLDLPDAQSGEEVSDAPDKIVINLLKDGTVKVNGEALDADGLRGALERAARVNPETPVDIRGDREVELQRVVGVMDVCRITGLTDIGMMTLDG